MKITRRQSLSQVAAILLVAAPLAFAHPVPNVPNLEPPSEKSRDPFLIPEGSSNLALSKEVTSNNLKPTRGALKQITDGCKEADDDSTVELRHGKQWVQVDLGQTANIYAVIVWLGDGPGFARAYHDVVVQVSDDKDFLHGVATIFNNDHDNSSGFGVGKDYAYLEDNTGRLIDAKGIAARYVRINSNGNTSNDKNHYREVEVWGLRGKPSGKMVPLRTELPKPLFR